MMDTFKNQYRTKSTRLQHWDYGANATYFVTLCTADKHCHFGGISEGELQLSALGQVAVGCWLEIPEHFPFVVLDAFVVMPNHVHGIIIINKPAVETQYVETQNLASLPPPPTRQNQFGPQSKNLASIIRGYKIGVTKQAKRMQPNFAWQPRYYDHIIRNEASYLKIAEYIQTNPLKWHEDKYHL